MQSLSPNSDMKQVLNYNTDELTLPNEQFSTYQQIESLLKQKSPRLVKKKDEIEDSATLDHAYFWRSYVPGRSLSSRGRV